VYDICDADGECSTTRRSFGRSARTWLKPFAVCARQKEAKMKHSYCRPSQFNARDFLDECSDGSNR